MTTDFDAATSFVIRAIPEDLLSDARAQLVDTAVGDSRARNVAARGGEPLRCCLRDAAAGECLILFNYRPQLPAHSPYQESGAIFVHAHDTDCRGAEPTPDYPQDWRGRSQVLRAYDADGFIHPATRVHDGTDPEGVIGDILAEPDVSLIHSRNVAYGCYMFTIERA